MRLPHVDPENNRPSLVSDMFEHVVQIEELLPVIRYMARALTESEVIYQSSQGV